MSEQEIKISGEIFNYLPDAAILADEEGFIVDVNVVAESLLQEQRETLRGSSLQALFPDINVSQTQIYGGTVFSSSRPFFYRLAAGRQHAHIDIEVRSSQFPANGKKYLLLSLINISHYREAYSKLSLLAYSDELTGLANRRQFMLEAEKEFERFLRYQTSLAFIMFDVDNFKQLNDQYGHDVGDAVLQRLTQVAREIFRETDVIARFGGDEFVVMMPETDTAHAYHAAERFRVALMEDDLFLSGESVDYTVSIGVAEVDKDVLSVQDLLKRVDKHMYTAKRAGRNVVKMRQSDVIPL